MRHFPFMAVYLLLKFLNNTLPFIVHIAKGFAAVMLFQGIQFFLFGTCQAAILCKLAKSFFVPDIVFLQLHFFCTCQLRLVKAFLEMFFIPHSFGRLCKGCCR